MGRGRPKKQVNKEAIKRLSIILDELKESNGITQTDFGNAIYVQQQTVSKLKTGETDMSIEYAKLIAEAFPQYRAEWILGLDDFKTPESFRLHQEALIRHENDLLALGVGALSELCGYTLTATLDFETSNRAQFALSGTKQGVQPESDYDPNEIVERIVKATASDAGAWEQAKLMPMMIVARDGKSVTVSRSEIDQLQAEIRDFVDFKLSRMLNR